jgi:hypothetical protein
MTFDHDAPTKVVSYNRYDVARPVAVDRAEERETIYHFKIGDRYVEHEITQKEAEAFLTCLQAALDDAKPTSG